MPQPDTQPSARRPARRITALALAAAALGPLTAAPPGAAADDPPKPAPAATTATTATTTRPAAAPAAAPKAVVAALAAAIDKADVAGVASALVADEAHAKWAASTVALAGALKKLDAAAVARFGEPGWAVSQNRLHLAEAFKAAEQGQEKVEGDAATLTVPGRDEPLRFKKGAGGQWVLSIAAEGAQAGARQRALYDRLAVAAARTADEVAAGGYDSPDAAARAFASRVADARLAE